MKLAALSIVALAVASTACERGQVTTPSEQPGSSYRVKAGSELAAYISSRVEAGFSGVVLVNVDGITILHEAYDPAGSGITTDSCFWIASVSKMFTAATAVMLQEQGQLDLHAPITAYLDDVPVDKKNISLHHLLTHTSGLDSTYVAEGVADRAQATRSILATPLQGPVGRSFLYSSDGYSLAAIIIETITGQPFERVVQEQILTPMRLASTGFWGFPTDETTCRLAPYETGNDIAAPLLRPNYGFRGTTGMRSTAADLLLWYQSLFDDVLVSAQARELIFTPYIEKAPDVSYGYGWNIVETTRGTRMLAHTGQDDLMAHVAYLYAFPEENVVLILLTDSGMDNGNETLVGLRKLLFPTQR